jgi:dihydrolipoamide dehydrogenase
MKQFDIVIIGAGPGGYVAAIKARQMGAKVALIEKQDIGGVCLNWGCIPTKALLKSAKVYRQFMHAEEYGIKVKDKSAILIDWPAMLKRKDGIVKRLTGGIKTLLDRNGVETIKGYAEVIDAHHVLVNGETIETKDLIIATGASPVIPPIEGVKESYERGIIVTSKGILALDAVPNRLVIIGGGVIGIEFATLFAALGTEVTIIEKADNILLAIDDEVRNAYLKILAREKVKIYTKAEVKSVNNNVVMYQLDGELQQIQADKILMSVGTKPNLNGLEKLNLETTRLGVVTNDKMETSIKHVYAIGDVNGKFMLAHVASAEGIIAVENIMGKESDLDYKRIPACVYGFPEIASVGITEKEAKEKGIKYKTSKFPLSANGKALAEGESEGFIKIIVDKQYGEVIGMHILAVNATDMIAEAVTTMELEGTVYELAKAIHPHPTLSEIVMEAAHGAIDRAIHI